MLFTQRSPAFFGELLALLALSGCGGGNAMPATAPPSATQTLALRTYDDPWSKAAPRERDIANNLYAADFAPFDYARADVRLSYALRQNGPYFSGHIKARGLKPNFAYQLKLAGKPIAGNRGTGVATSYVTATSRVPGAAPVVHFVNDTKGNPTPINGDDWTNQQLGYAGRWWDNSRAPSTNLNDDYFQNNYPSQTIYGYIFMGDFFTDAAGNAETDIAAAHSYHITWQDEQYNAKREALAGYFSVNSAPPFYGYQSPIQKQSVKLWYEYESGRTRNVRLAPGTYHCRLLVTEEAFHTAGGFGGGVWQTVLATEVIDADPTNDLTFEIGG